MAHRQIFARSRPEVLDLNIVPGIGKATREWTGLVRPRGWPPGSSWVKDLEQSDKVELEVAMDAQVHLDLEERA